MFILASMSTPLQAGVFGPSDFEKCSNEKVAVELKLKYCYKDKVAAENELDALKKQYNNEKLNYEAKIKSLEGQIDTLNKKYDSLNKQCDTDRQLRDKRIEELQKTISILQQKSTGRENDLLKENKDIQARYEAELATMKKQLEDERKKCIKDLAELKMAYEEKIAGFQTTIKNLNEELASLKKLSNDQKNELERLASQQNELEKQLEDEIKKGEIRLKKFHDRLIINLDNRICFDSGSSVLKNDVKNALKKIGRILETYPENRVIIEGHTDTDKVIGGNFRDNWQLSTERALSVLNFVLDNNKGLDKTRFAAAGYGEFNPNVPNNSPANKALNRRVDIVLIPRVPK